MFIVRRGPALHHPATFLPRRPDDCSMRNLGERRVVAMFVGGDDGDDGDEVPRRDRIRVPVPAGIALTLCAVATLAFGLFPDVLVTPARAGTPAVVALDAPVPTSAAASSVGR